MKLILILFLMSTSVFALTQVKESEPANMKSDSSKETEDAYRRMLEKKKERVSETSKEVKQREEYDNDDDDEDDEEDDDDERIRY
ncbi:MAG: hypothetical protein ACJ76H_03130 [Bacteriovoracaceae bacterium]